MIPVLGMLLEGLAEQGLSLLAGAIKAKGKEVIEEKLGVKIPEKAEDLTPAVLTELKKAEIAHEEFLVNAQIKKAEIELEEEKQDNANTADARSMNARIQESANADHLAKVAAYYLDFIIVVATLLLAAFVIFFTIPTANKELVYMALGSLLTMCGTILNFHRGTSSGSKHKDALLKKAMEV